MGSHWRDYMREESAFAPRSGAMKVTWWLIGINTVLWFIYAGALGHGGPGGGLYRLIHDNLLVHPDQVFGAWRLWQPFTAMWLHDPYGLGHIFFNMLFLFFFGRYVEQILGRRGYLHLYFGAGLVCTFSLVPYYWLTGDATPALGASGAIYGVGVFLAFKEPRLQVIFFVIRMPLWVLVGVLMVGFQLIQLLVMNAGTGGTIGHLAGAAFGWVYFKWIWSPLGIEQPGFFERLARKRRARRDQKER
ncbi:MAG: rhomboid family intramembrane serine protease, partial [Planctomycetota bacterium]